MRAVYSHSDHGRVGFFKSVLEDAGIDTFIKNESSYNATEFSTLIVAPTLCVINDDDYARARKLIELANLPPPVFRADWTCPSCGEQVPGNFDVCWKCGTEHPSGAPTTPHDA
jgi:hypothetical protein